MVTLAKLKDRREAACAKALRVQDRAAAFPTERNRNAANEAWDAYGRADRNYREAHRATPRINRG